MQINARRATAKPGAQARDVASSVDASSLLLIISRWGAAVAAAAAEASKERATRADVEHVGVEVDDALHILVWLHLEAQLCDV